MKFVLLLALGIAPVSGQLQSVDMQVSGLDCPSCADSIGRRLGRVRGVESATFDAAKNIVTLKLKPANTVTLSAIRDALKSLGYTPGDAKITAQGELKSGVLSFPHQERAFTVEPSGGSGAVTVAGNVPASKAGETDRLRIEK
jgi:copper chaperone CopZ